MSDYRNHGQSSELEPALALIGVGCAIVLGFSLYFAKSVSVWLGADFWTTFWAVVHTAVGLGLFGGAAVGLFALGILKASRIGSAIGLFLSIAATVTVWSFCKVAHSMALGGANPDNPNAFGFPVYGDTPLWDSGWFQWGLCLALIAAVVGFALSAAQDDYY